MICCLTAITKGGASVARVGRSPAGRAFCAARAFEKIRPAPSARAADRGQALFEGMEAAVVGRCVIEGAPRRRLSTRSGSADEEQQRGAANEFFHGSSPGGACPAGAPVPKYGSFQPLRERLASLCSCFVQAFVLGCFYG